MEFRKATRKQRKLRLAIDGPTGAGKTYSALAIASGLGSRVGLIDTENSSSELYAGKFDFEVLVLSRHRPQDYIDAIDAAAKAGFDVLVIDSLSHAWSGREGALEQVDKAAARSKSGNSFTAWREVTPHHNRMVDAIIHAPMHLIATMRSKMAYELVEENGKKVPQKIGMQPIQREGLEYEFDFVADMDLQHRLIVAKTRCEDFDGDVIERPTSAVGLRLLAWLNAGEKTPQDKSKLEQWRTGWVSTLGRQLFADTVGCDLGEVDDYVPPKEKPKRDALIATLEAARREVTA